ncbi:hypothetical protein [Streptomyces albogriseolus]|uniref:hypothetical protein n=1 Tax=Streptomyces albogriseolus TaxID=1887 RepID=UPI00345FF467
MDASVLSALVGLIGVGAGAGATFGGVVYQQRHGTREARTARLRGEAVAAAEKILSELLAMQHSLRLGSYGAAEEEQRDYRRALQHHHATIQLHSQWLPDAELRSRLTVNALYTQIGPVGDSRSGIERRGHGMALCADSIACLGAFLRSEALPVRDAYVDQILARWPEGRELHTFIVSGPPVESDETPDSAT